MKMDSNSTKEKLQNSVVVADGAELKSCYMQKFRLYETALLFKPGNWKVAFLFFVCLCVCVLFGLLQG